MIAPTRLRVGWIHLRLATLACLAFGGCVREEDLTDRGTEEQVWSYFQSIGQAACGDEWAPGAISVSRCGDMVVITQHRVREGGWVDAHCAFGPYAEGDLFEFQSPRSTPAAWCIGNSGEGDRLKRITRWKEVDEGCVGVPLRGGPGTDCFLCGGAGAPCEAGLQLEVTCE